MRSKTRGVCSSAVAILVTIVRKKGYTSHIKTKVRGPRERGGRPGGWACSPDPLGEPRLNPDL